MPDFPERASALEKTVEENVGETADAAAARKARTQGGALPVTTPTRSAEEPTTPASVAQVPTVGLEDLLGGAPVPVVRQRRRKNRRTTPRKPRARWMIFWG